MSATGLKELPKLGSFLQPKQDNGGGDDDDDDGAVCHGRGG